MKSFFWRSFFCLVPVALAALVTGWALQRYFNGRGGFNLGVDLVGGTILVYEVDPTKQLKGGYQPEQLAASLKRRIDPADLYNVTIRPVGQNRVEIILPTGGTFQARAAKEQWDNLVAEARSLFEVPEAPTLAVPQGDYDTLKREIRAANPKVDEKALAEFAISRSGGDGKRRALTGEKVAEIKEKISQQGSLEFRILANSQDDAEAIESARRYFTEAKTNAERKAEIARNATRGEVPPAPKKPDASTSFATSLGTFSYSWIELGRSERRSHNLDNGAENDDSPAKHSGLPRNQFWKQAAEARKNGELLTMSGGLLLYSREVPNPERLPAGDRDKKIEYFMLSRDPVESRKVTGDHLTFVAQSTDDRGRLAVSFHLNSTGAGRFHEVTTTNRPEGSHFRHLAIVLDGQIMSAPTINSPIRESGQISGNYTPKEANFLIDILRSGALPATLKPLPVSENTIGPTLGADTIRAGAFSVILAFAAVLVFMAFYYRFAGIVACVALLANLLLTVAVMVLLNATFTLPGLAGLVLMLGMAVDANVLIYERLREERERGCSLPQALRNGYDRAFPTIIDTHLSSIFTAIVLYVVGNDQLKGFGVSLTLGLVISLFTSLYMTRLIFDYWQTRGWLRQLSMLKMFDRPNINFMAIRHLWFTATIILTIFGISVFLMRGKEGLNIDFNGGTNYGGRLKEKMDIQDIRALLGEERQKERLALKDVAKLDEEGRAWRLTYADGEARDVRLAEAVEKEFVEKHASELPDWSVEQIFLSDPEYSEGTKSKMFNVRTSEMARELVEASVDRLLRTGEKGDLLAKVNLQSALEAGAKPASAVLTFTDPDTKEAAYASPAQVAMLLERQFAATTQGEEEGKTMPRFTILPEGEQKEGRAAKMRLTMADPMERKKLESVLAGTQQAFANRPQPESLENFDKQLAGETQRRALYAILASWGAILLYLWFRFGSWTFGLAAVLCLIHDLLFTLGIIAFCHYLHEWVPGLATILGLQDFKIDLPSVAALLTLVGYSVNDTIVVFDRIREVRGKNPDLTPQMINDSVNQTLSRTLLASLTTWLVVFVLYVAGGTGVHLFAFVMVIGVIVGTYSSIYIASPLLLIFGEGQRATNRASTPQPAAVR